MYIVSPTLHNTARTAALAAAVGSRDTTWIDNALAQLGASPRFRMYHTPAGGSRTLKFSQAVVPARVAGRFRIPVPAAAPTANIDILDGTLEVVVEKASDPTVYIGATCTLGGGVDTFALAWKLLTTDTLAGDYVYIDPPGYDSLLDPVQTGSLVTGTNVASLTLTLPAQPASGSKVVAIVGTVESSAPSAYSPSSASPALWLDISDLSTLFQDTAGTVPVTAVGQTVKRINNKGSAGGYFSNSTGWPLEQGAGSSYKLNMSGTSLFASSFNATSVGSVSAIEFIVGFAPSLASSNTDPWYAPSVIQVANGNSGLGIAFHTSTQPQFWNVDAGGADKITSLTYTLNAPQVFTIRHASGNLSAAVGIDSALTTSVASGDSVSLANPIGLGNSYHGSFPYGDGDLYQVIGGAPFSTTDRGLLQQWVTAKMGGTSASSSSVAVDDNAATGNKYELLCEAKSSTEKTRVTILAAQSVAPGSGTYTLTANAPGGRRMNMWGVALEHRGLIGLQALDRTAVTSNDAQAGSIDLASGTIVQAEELVIAAMCASKADSALGIALPGGSDLTMLRTTQDATVAAGAVAYKISGAIAAQVARFIYDAGAPAGEAVGALVTLKAGTNVDPPGGQTSGGGGSGGSGSTNVEALTTALLRTDMDGSTNHDIVPMYNVDPSWSWGSKPRAGVGANPPSGWTHFTPWFVCATPASVNMGAHNWRLAVYEMWHVEKRAGVYRVVSKAIGGNDDMWGGFYEFVSNNSDPADTRIQDGALQVYFPGTGASFHGYNRWRDQIANDGATQVRATLVLANIVPDNPALPIGVTTAPIALGASGDYWQNGSVTGPIGVVNNDFGIGRHKYLPVTPTKRWYTYCTATTDAERDALRTFLATVGVRIA